MDFAAGQDIVPSFFGDWSVLSSPSYSHQSNDDGCGQSSFIDHQPVNTIEVQRMADSPLQGSLVIDDVKKFSNELWSFVHSCIECDLAKCNDFLDEMVKRGIMKRYEELANHLQSVDLNRDASTSGKVMYEKENNEILDDSQKSDDELRYPSSLSESELASSDNDSTNSSQTNESCSQESSESKRPWYERLKPCAGDIYIRGRGIKRTCKEYCDDNDEAKNLIGKFYNMNSDGFKKELESIKEDNPSEDPYYLLDLVLCAHVRKGYSFDLSKKGSKRERFERKWINWIRRDKHRIQKKQKKKEKGSKRVSYSS